MSYKLDEYYNNRVLEANFQQQDCYLSKMSKEYPLLISVLGEKLTRESDNFIQTNVIINIESLDNLFPARYVRRAVEEGYFTNDSIELIKVSGKNILIKIISPFTELKSSYVNSLRKCIRIYPSLISEGLEKWRFICEDDESTEEFIRELNRLQKTKILEPTVKKFQDLELEHRVRLILDTFNEIETKLSPGEKEILLYAFSHNYFTIERNINLRDISSSMKKSKSLVSKQLNRAEVKVMSSVIKLLVENHNIP